MNKVILSLDTVKICSNCSSTTTNKNFWYRDGSGGWHCNKCHQKLVYAPKHNQNRFKYKGEYIRFDEPPRIGVCGICRAIKGQINAQTGKLCKQTQRAHITYHDNEPLKDTIELCVSCHKRYDEGIPSDRYCFVCRNKETCTRQDGSGMWHKIKGLEGKFRCNRCHCRWAYEQRKNKEIEK